MRTVLINPPWHDASNPMLWGVRAGSRWPHMQTRPARGELPRYIPFPFFMAHAAALIQQAGHDVLLIDAVAENWNENECIERITAFNPHIIFSECSSPSLTNDLEFLQLLHAQSPSAQYIAAGTHPPDMARQLLTDHPHISYWIAGEYEETLAGIIEHWPIMDASRFPGLISAHHPAVKLATVHDLSALPPPLYEQLPISHYADPVCGLPTPTAQTWISRGCPYGCTFCVWPQVIYGSRSYRTRSIDRALDEVEQLIRHHGCESFYFDDDTTNMGESRMIQLAASIKKHGLHHYPWSMMARADCMTEPMVQALSDAGMYSIKYGVETISDQLLNACDKGTNKERLFIALDATRQAGIKMHLTFTFGIPGETPETIQQTMDFALSIQPETAQMSYCIPFPGTELFNQCKQNGWLTSQQWQHYLGLHEPVISTPKCSASELKTAYEKAVKEWNQFTSDRLERRRNRLRESLLSAVKQGADWCGIGDMPFAGLTNDAISSAISDPERADILVFAHPRDEEKLYRRWRRNHPRAKTRILKLYDMQV